MKDEEMAEEFVDSKKSFWRQGRTCIDSVKQAFLAGLKAGRPQWHDLRKDPNDLPKEPRQYLCQIECCVDGDIIYECSYYDAEYDSWSDSYGDVIAWKEIVPPKEIE